jgi:hypothetical protein
LCLHLCLHAACYNLRPQPASDLALGSLCQGRHLFRTVSAGLALPEPTLLLQVHLFSTPFLLQCIFFVTFLSLSQLLTTPRLGFLRLGQCYLLAFTNKHVIDSCPGTFSAGTFSCTPCSPGSFSTSTGDIDMHLLFEVEIERVQGERGARTVSLNRQQLVTWEALSISIRHLLGLMHAILRHRRI